MICASVLTVWNERFHNLFKNIYLKSLPSPQAFRAALVPQVHQVDPGKDISPTQCEEVKQNKQEIKRCLNFIQ